MMASQLFQKRSELIIFMIQWETNVYEIGAKYAADPMWAIKVTHFMNELEAYSETSVEEPSLSISL